MRKKRNEFWLPQATFLCLLSPLPVLYTQTPDVVVCFLSTLFSLRHCHYCSNTTQTQNTLWHLSSSLRHHPSAPLTPGTPPSPNRDGSNMSSSDEEQNTSPTQEALGKQLQFVKILKRYTILLEKSQTPSVKEAKAKAANDMLVELSTSEGIIMTVAQLSKKISNMKTTVKAKADAFETGNKKIVLAKWEEKFLKLMDPDNPILKRVPGAVQVGIRSSVLTVRNELSSSAPMALGSSIPSTSAASQSQVPLPPWIIGNSQPLASSHVQLVPPSSPSVTNAAVSTSGSFALRPTSTPASMALVPFTTPVVAHSSGTLILPPPPPVPRRSSSDIPPPPARANKRKRSEDALDAEETEDTKLLSTPQLNRLVLLRQLKLINLKINKLQHGEQGLDAN